VTDLIACPECGEQVTRPTHGERLDASELGRHLLTHPPYQMIHDMGELLNELDQQEDQS
jgi:hypothetical protein